MALFPKIQSPCPYKGDKAAIMDGRMCRLCKRQVFDLSDMSDGERVTFMQGCGEEVCVTYRVRPVLAAAVLVAAALGVPTAAAACVDTVTFETGGIKDTAHVQYVQYTEDPADRATPALPIVYDDKPAQPADKAKAGKHGGV